jgi:methylglutamate dehydrogenase subunit D
VKLPQGTQHAFAGETRFIGIGRGVWLATSETRENDFATLLRKAMEAPASISDQPDGDTILRVSGRRVRAALDKLIPIDVHPRSFGIASVAVTAAVHIGVTMWRLEDEGEDVRVFELAVPRSMAGSFWQALMESAAKFGVVASHS